MKYNVDSTRKNIMTDLAENWRAEMGPMNEVSSVNYWNKRAEDYNDFITTSRFSYGERIVEILLQTGILQKDMRVLEIAGGVGALTLPLAAKVKSVTTIEPAEQMVSKLRYNAQKIKTANVTILMETCQETGKREETPVHDLAVMCHASWQFPDLRWLLRFMERMGSGRASVADSISGPDTEKTNFYKSLGIPHHSFDRFTALNEAIRSLGRQPESQLFPFTMMRSTASAMAMITQVLTKYRQPEERDIRLIEDHVRLNSISGIYREESTMGVLWWQNQTWSNSA